MALATLKANEKNINHLVDRLYPSLDTAGKNKVVAALLRENPYLKETDTLLPGMVVTVPKVPGIEIRPATEHAEPVDEVQQLLVSGVNELHKDVSRRMAAVARELDSQQKLLQSELVKQAIETSGGEKAKTIARTLSDGLQARIADLDKEKKTLKELVEQVQADLQTLSNW